MAEIKVPEGIVRSLSIVTAGDGCVSALYIDGVRKLVESCDDTESMMADEVISLLEEESFSGKVMHIQRHTCDGFFEETCLEDPEIFKETCPELLIHLSED